jgi:selenocysteine lyase/cysteine desulfurase
VLRGLGLAPGDEVVTTTDEHFGLLGPLGASAADVVVVPPDPEAILAAVTPRTRLIASSQVLWTTGAVLPLAELRERAAFRCSPTAHSRSARFRRPPTASTSSRSRARSGSAARRDGRARRRGPERLAVTSPSYFAQAVRRPTGLRAARRRARLEPGWWSQARCERCWRRSAAAELVVRARRDAAERCRELLAPRVEVSTPRTARRSSLPPGDEEPAAVVSRLSRAGVHVRELPGRGLVRVSCGWWTSDEDIDRLVAALDR